ncbi:MAG: polyprenyl synthetase family protein [bacterium]
MNYKKDFFTIEQDLEKVRNKIKDTFKNDIPYVKNINNYIFSFLGKMIRPSLVFFSSKSVSQKLDSKTKEQIIALSATVEIIHIATLIHDDIIDNAFLRRGQKSVNKKYGNNIAILIGDYLFAKAFFLLSNYFQGKVLEILSETVASICCGEMLQVKFRFNADLSEKKYLEIIKNKTGILMSACCETSALAVNASDKEINALKEYGFNLGIAFQIIDDCLDFVGQEKKVKKTLGLDIENGELTLPLIYFKKRFAKEIFSNDKSKRYQEIISFWNNNPLKRKEALDFAFKTASRYATYAKESISILKPSIFKDSLLNLPLKVIERSN